MQPIKQLTETVSLYGFGIVVARLLNYLLVPLYTSKLTPADYGIITEWYAYAALLQIVYIYGLETTYFRFSQKISQAFDLIISTLLISSLVFSGLLIVFATPIVKGLAHPGCERYVYYFATILSIDTLLTIPLAQIRLQHKALRFVYTKFFQIILNIGFNLLFLYQAQRIYTYARYLGTLGTYIVHYYNPTQHVDHVFMANLLSSTVTLVILSKPLLRVKIRWSWQELRPMLRYAWPLALMGLAGTINEIMGRAMLRHWLPSHLYPGQSNETILGIFGACQKLSVLLLVCIQAFRYAAEPFFLTHVQPNNAPTLLAIVMHCFVSGACFVWFAVSAQLDTLGTLLLRQVVYHEALEVVPYLMLGYLFLGIYYNLSMWFKLTNQTHYGAWLTSIGALVTIVLNAGLIPRMGYWGSVWATVASYATISGLCYYWGQKHYPIPYPLRQLFLYIIETMACIYVTRHITYANWLHSLGSNVLLTLCFGILLYHQVVRYHTKISSLHR